MKVHLIATDGGLRTVPHYLVDELKLKGWRIVLNPKRTYYAEYDQTNPNYQKEEDLSEESTLLQVEVL